MYLILFTQTSNSSQSDLEKELINWILEKEERRKAGIT